ncbi:MAG: hypothetical protein M1817_004598 [Caeruleum heppii]|nr:MAG: hypothetical protein M1817_004598 [Caeruleum heppii]
MMRWSYLLAFVALFAEPLLGKKGGGRGGGGGASSGGDSSSGGSGGGDEGSSSSGGSSSYTPAPKCNEGKCECLAIDQRIDIFALPGSYYNGTVQVTHKIEQNSARDLAAMNPGQGGQRCNNQDDQEKTYTYPALFAVSPNGNDSDRNPIWWSLRGFQPPGQPTNPTLDVFQEWIHIRSSDFVVSDNSMDGYNYETDETHYHNKTETYWDTALSSSEGSVWNANATYTAQPPPGTRGTAFSNTPLEYRAPSSNYATLSDVCYYGYELFRKEGALPTSYIPEDNLYIWTTTPTIFFDLGALARIDGIGADSLEFSLDGAMSRGPVHVSTSPVCSGDYYASFTRTLEMAQWEEESSYVRNPSLWNMSATVSLRFEGRIIRENSTAINSTGTETPQWAAEYTRTQRSSFATSPRRSSAMSTLPSAFAEILVMIASWCAVIHIIM